MAENKNNIKSFFKDFIIAGTSGSIINTLMAPIFNIKLEIDYRSMGSNNLDSIKESKKGFISIFFQFVQEKGAIKLWKRNSSVAKNAFWFQGIAFSIKNFIQNYCNFTKFQNGVLENFLVNFFSGMIGGSIALFVIFPFSYPIVMQVKMSGFKDHYKNFRFYIIPVLIYRGTYFGVFDSIKTNKDDKEIAPFLEILEYSFFSTFMAQLMTAPFQIAKFKMLRQKQVQSFRIYFDLLKKESSTAIKQCLQFKFPVLYLSIVGALVLTSYETLSRIVQSY